MEYGFSISEKEAESYFKTVEEMLNDTLQMVK